MHLDHVKFASDCTTASIRHLAVRLVRMAPEFRRTLSDKYRVREDDHTNFADGCVCIFNWLDETVYICKVHWATHFGRCSVDEVGVQYFFYLLLCVRIHRFPILVTTTGSLRAVSDAAAASSSASASPVRSVQFRPNVIVATEHAWEEDDWHTLRITSAGAGVDENSDATMELRLVKPCTRCEV